MQVFTCEDRFDAIASCIYTAWEWALRNGHENVRLQKEPIRQTTLFDEYVHVDPDEQKTEKVIRSIRRKISEDAYLTVFYAAHSHEDVLNDIYLYLRLGFSAGAKIRDMLTVPCVMKLMEIRRNVGNEVHFMHELSRFDRAGNVLVAHIEPKNNVLAMASDYFADRMPSEHWIMIDDRRLLAAVHKADEDTYIRHLTAPELERLRETEKLHDIYTDLWKTFFHAISIRQRENYRCQRNHFPLWRRTHATEFRPDPKS